MRIMQKAQNSERRKTAGAAVDNDRATERNCFVHFNIGKRILSTERADGTNFQKPRLGEKPLEHPVCTAIAITISRTAEIAFSRRTR
jgi:hypothetical protein